MKKRIVLLVSLFLLQVVSLWQWLSCVGFASSFHFSSFDLSLRLIESIHGDTQTPLLLVRLFHNKLAGIGLDTFKAYVQFWNVLFLTGFLSLAGMIGFLTQFYAFISAKRRRVILWLLFGVVLLSPLLEIFGYEKISFIVRFIIISGSFLLWSLLGYWYLLKQKTVGFWIGLVLLLVSLWYLLTFSYCN